VVGSPDIHFLISFDQATPGDIGYRASISAYSREVLAATFGMHIEDLPDFPFTADDPLIVNRTNPVDETGPRRTAVNRIRCAPPGHLGSLIVWGAVLYDSQPDRGPRRIAPEGVVGESLE